MKYLAWALVACWAAGSAASVAAQPADVAASEKSLMQQAVDRFENNDKGSRIVGGTKAQWELNKWQVALVYKKDKDNGRAQFCGGSILSPGWIVTAAHCIDKKFDATAYQVLSGTASLQSGGKRSRILSYTVHESWRVPGNKNRYDNDIALLKVDPETPLLGISIPLVRKDMPIDALKVLVSGWGVTEYRPTGSTDLQQVTLPSVPQDTCNELKSYDKDVTDMMFCAGEYKKDACQGDSGGPATALVDQVRVLIGIVSWGVGCGQRDKYGVYTRLPVYTDWITTKTGGEIK